MLAKKVSVITINLNNLNGLQRTFESVISQDYPDLEYLVIDGDSNDGSKDFISQHSDRIGFWLCEKDKGVYEAMNKGIQNSTGDYLIFLNSGDWFSDSSSILRLIANSEGEDLVYGNILVQETEKSWIKKYPESLNFRYFYFESLPHPACLISRRILDLVGLYDTSLKIASDWKFFLLAVVKHRCTYRYVDAVISTFSYDGLSSKVENKNRLGIERKSTLKKHFNFYFIGYDFYLRMLNKSIYHGF